MSFSRGELLVASAGFVLLLMLAYALTGSEPARGSEHRDKDDLSTVVASGNDIEGEQVGGKNEPSDRPLPQTGVAIDRPLLLSLVLLLDGALALMLSQRKQLRAFSPH